MVFFTENFISWVCSEVIDLFTGTVKNHITARRDKSDSEKELWEFIKRKQSEFDTVDLESEYDFQGLSTFIIHNLPNEINSYIFSMSESQMNTAANTIINKAIEYAQANTSESKIYVRSLITKCLQILHDFFASNLFDDKDKLEISTVCRMISHDGNETRKLIVESMKNTGTNDGLNERKVIMINAIDSLKLPNYTREKTPKNVPSKDLEISIPEFNVLFDDEQIQTQLHLIMSIIKKIKELIIDLKQFHTLCGKPYGEGGYIHLLWEDLVEKESQIEYTSVSNESEQYFKDYCSEHELLYNDRTYNYYKISCEIERNKNEFFNVKGELLSLMIRYMKEITNNNPQEYIM